MKKKMLAVAVASALVSPTAFAATDASGMKYTSASEGFYGSLRTQYYSSGVDHADGDITNSFSRLGVRGSIDLGGGLSGLYRYEWRAGDDTNDSGAAHGGGNGRVRLRYVGLTGGFGTMLAGQVWTNTYNFVYSRTDVFNDGSGWYAPQFRTANVIQYTSPDLNGFSFGIDTQIDGDSAAIATDDYNDLDWTSLNASYTNSGFTGALSYLATPDAFDGKSGAKEDQKIWGVGLGYSQNNWGLSYYYQRNNDEDRMNTFYDANSNGTFDAANDFRLKRDDQGVHSFAATMNVDKLSFALVWEQRTQDITAFDIQGVTGDRKYEVSQRRVGVEATYHLGSRARTWASVINQEDKLAASGAYTTASDDVTEFRVGLRMDF